MSPLPEAAAVELLDITVDESPPGVSASLVVEPRSAEDVARVLTTAADHRVRVMPVGSGSMLEGADTDIAVVMGRLSGIVDYQPDDLTVVVGAGTTLGELTGVLTERRLTAVLPETTPGRTVGGVVASGASGYRRLAYGPTRDRVLEVTMVTGYGEIVRAGGRLVKNVTGYDLSRLVTGSFGSLGIIVSTCLKLWPEPQVSATVTVDDPVRALETCYRPAAVLETQAGSMVYLQGDPDTVQDQGSRLGGDVAEGFQWPEPGIGSASIAVRVPPRILPEAVVEVRSVEPGWFVAQHGVGVIDLVLEDLDVETVERLRSWTEERGGSVVVSDATLTPERRWGTPPGTIEIQRRLKGLFDPAGVCNPGVLPGGL